MATRILGPTGSRRRRRFLIVPILLVGLTAFFVIATLSTLTLKETLILILIDWPWKLVIFRATVPQLPAP